MTRGLSTQSWRHEAGSAGSGSAPTVQPRSPCTRPARPHLPKVLSPRTPKRYWLRRPVPVRGAPTQRSACLSLAGQQLGFAGTGIGCPTRPPGEQVDWIRGSPNDSGPIVDDEIGFLDPPGLKGTGFPSGGNNPANGVVLYRFMSGTGGTSAIETCTLPTSDHSLCTAVLNDFAGRSWQVGP